MEQLLVTQTTNLLVAFVITFCAGTALITISYFFICLISIGIQTLCFLMNYVSIKRRQLRK